MAFSVGSLAAPVEVIDVEPEAFRAMLKFIYTDELSVQNGDTLFDVLCVGKKKFAKFLVHGRHFTYESFRLMLKDISPNEPNGFLEYK